GTLQTTVTTSGQGAGDFMYCIRQTFSQAFNAGSTSSELSALVYGGHGC
ncbi:MAG: hypothetical protein JWM85_3500, partial [Acidimicrobiaceae bacterium]|nr:hypothetical protein [Acidimicrobiaceae bacterium]